MNNTIKLSVLAIALAGAAASWAAAVTLPDATASAEKTQVLPANCPALVEAVSIKQSANVAAAFDCGATHVGISTANWKGQGNYFQIHSGGGNPLKQHGTSANQGGKYPSLSAANTDVATGATAALTKAESTT